MDKRTLLALVLSALVLVTMPYLFPGLFATHRPPMADSTQASGATASTSDRPNATPDVPLVSPATNAAPSALSGGPARFDTVARGGARIQLQAPGAGLESVTLLDYRDLSAKHGATVTLAQPTLPLIRYRLVVNNRDTVDLRTLATRERKDSDGVTFDAASPAVAISYHMTSGGYLTHVRGTVAGAGPGDQLLIDLPGDFEATEADSLDDHRHFAYGYKRTHEDVSTVAFSKLDSLHIRTDSGPMEWVAARDKYFLLALLAADSVTPFRALVMQGGPRGALIAGQQGRRSFDATHYTAAATAVLPLTAGAFAFDVYAGPQSWSKLRSVGHDLENVNPYAGLLHAVVQPFATIVLKILLWMKTTFNVSYGWVLIIFGVTIRMVLWPLNQTAMRTSIKMQRLQPELVEVQKKYAKDPEAQRSAQMKLYQEHGMSPLSPLFSCLPMLLPMPVLFALYFVFQNTIELRGVPFLWLPDLSLRDPYYITPVLMGASMFALSWIGMRAAPPNPQAKIMGYMMPVMFTVMFLKFASGLNLYYGIQNLTSLPQQWLITRERARATTQTQASPKRSSG